MFLKFLILLLFIIRSNSFILSPSKQVGFGVPCSNRAWASISNLISAAQREAALQSKLGPLPFFNDTLYLAGVYYRVESDSMINNLTAQLRNLVLVECVDYKGEFIQTIEDHLNNIVNAKSWSGVAHDLLFDYFYGRAYWVELFSSNISFLSLTGFIGFFRTKVKMRKLLSSNLK